MTEVRRVQGGHDAWVRAAEVDLQILTWLAAPRPALRHALHTYDLLTSQRQAWGGCDRSGMRNIRKLMVPGFPRAHPARPLPAICERSSVQSKKRVILKRCMEMAVAVSRLECEMTDLSSLHDLIQRFLGERLIVQNSARVSRAIKRVNYVEGEPGASTCPERVKTRSKCMLGAVEKVGNEERTGNLCASGLLR